MVEVDYRLVRLQPAVFSTEGFTERGKPDHPEKYIFLDESGLPSLTNIQFCEEPFISLLVLKHYYPTTR